MLIHRHKKKLYTLHNNTSHPYHTSTPPPPPPTSRRRTPYTSIHQYIGVGQREREREREREMMSSKNMENDEEDLLTKIQNIYTLYYMIGR
jgi:hypothetical protein